ncbi:MAG: MBG domain-containing protein, partial [Burkholderiales bacterium]
GAVSITSGNNVTLNDTNAVALGASTVSGNLAITANGAISDSGNVAVTGTTTLAAGAANSITLDNANNFGGAVSVTSGNNVTLNDTNAVALGASTVSGNLAITANGAITDSGNIAVTGTTTLAAGITNNITLDNANNFGGAVSITSGNNVTLNDTNAVALGASTVSGNLAINANGAITDSGNVAVTGTTTLAAGAANSITLDNANNFGGAVSITSGNNVTLNDINAMQLGAMNVAGLVDARTQSGNLTLTGLIATASTSASAVTLIADVTAVPNATGTGGNLINSGGAITTGAGGAWRVYTGNPTGTNRGGLVEAGKRYNVDDGSDPIAAGNRIYFRNQPALTLTADNQNKTYGAANPAFTYSTSGLIDGDLIGAAISAGPGFAVDGTTSTAGHLTALTPHNIIPSAATATSLGYTLSYANGSLTVNPLTLTGAAIGAVTTTYGTPAAAGAVSFGNVVGADVVTSTASVNTGALSASGNPVVGSYTQAAGAIIGADAGNYAFAGFTSGANYTVNQRALTVSATGVNKTYDGTTTATVTLSDNRVAGDVFTDSYTGAAFVDKNFGVGKTVNVSGINVAGTDAGNYTFNTTAVTTANIDKRDITVTATNDTKIYGNADPAFVFNVGGLGLAGSDTITSVFTGALARAAGENVAPPYTINQGTLASDANYNVTTFTPGQFTITPRALTITADNKTKLTGDPLPLFTATYAGFAFADNSVSLAGALAFATPATAGSPAGAYVITPSGQTATNYTISYVNGALTVGAAPALPAGVGSVPTDILSSINAGGDQLPPSAVSGPPAVPTTFAAVQPNNVTEGGAASPPGGQQAISTGAVNNLLSVVNGGVNLPAGVTQ